jgi:hypothetical protein
VQETGRWGPQWAHLSVFDQSDVGVARKARESNGIMNTLVRNR